MIFTSGVFVFFLLTFFFVYWKIPGNNLKTQNSILLIANLVFYAYWDWRLLGLLLFSCSFNFYLGKIIYESKNLNKRTWLVLLSLVQNIGLLLFFKYFNFFILSFKEFLALIGIMVQVKTLNLILPLGISFYTFRIISYVLDIDKNKIKPTADWVVFFAYVSFFPSLMAGPIDRAKLLIPQLEKKRIFQYNEIIDGLKQLLWGLFKKLVVAESCSPLVDHVFDNAETTGGSTLLMAIFFYAIQMYADFSGYSDMAMGIAKLVGFKITRNFAYPFFSQNIAEYWRKWHISLTAWLTEYVYTPLSISFRYYKNWGLVLAIVINFIVVGLWHGANWTFIFFGFLHSIYFIPIILRGQMNKKKEIEKGKIFPSLKEFFNIIGTFSLVLIAFIFFRSNNVKQAFHYIFNIIKPSLFSMPEVAGKATLLITLFFIFVLFTIEWFQRDQEYGLKFANVNNRFVRWAFYYFLIFSVFYFGNTNAGTFLYAQY